MDTIHEDIKRQFQVLSELARKIREADALAEDCDTNNALLSIYRAALSRMDYLDQVHCTVHFDHMADRDLGHLLATGEPLGTGPSWSDMHRAVTDILRNRGCVQ